MNLLKFNVLNVLASETRFKIFAVLIEKKTLNVEEIAHAVAMTHSAVSHQLTVLKMYDVVSCEKDGRHMIYEIAKTEAGKMARKIVRI